MNFIALYLAIFFVSSCTSSLREDEFHGAARIDANGNISLSITCFGDGWVIHKTPYYEPTDENYIQIADHVGPIAVGEEVSIDPLPNFNCRNDR